MILKSLEIQGFKSFPDKTKLTFGDGITAVVGPNGSGKSNISDAIRWVLGEQSSKTLRGGRMEDVIFGGSAARKAQGFAEVSLAIDNSARFLAFDADEVTVTRRYYRSGESEYLLNNAEVRLKDVFEVFMDTGLGKDGYSIIGQGRIAEIVGAKSEDRREIFEEAAGISKFRYKKEESERRLAAAEENLLRLHDILSELEGRLEPLRRQSEKAKKYIDLASEKKTLEIGLWIFSLDRQRGAVRDNENRLLLVKSQYDEAERKTEETEAEIEKIYLESQKKAAETEELRKKAASLEEEALKRLSAADVLRNDIAHNNENIERIRAEIGDVNRSREQSETEIKARREQEARRQAELEGLNARAADVTQSLQSLAQEGEQFSGRLGQVEKELSGLMDRASAANLEISSLTASLSHRTDRAAAVKSGIAEKNERRKQATALLSDRKKELETCAEKLGELKNAVGGYEIKLKARSEKLLAAEQNERAVSLRLSEKAQRASMLRDMERHMEGFANSVKAVMKEKEHGALRGIHGPVSRLIRVPSRYAAAIETALGGSLQNIVVDNEENAKAAIGLLKRTDAGRATFLPLTTISGKELGGGFGGYEGYVGLASGLVQYEPVYAGIVVSLLGRTAVARDLDCAVAMARGTGYKFRVVTLDGQVVNAGGSLTGGSAGRNSGLLSRAGEIEALDAQAAELKQQMEKIIAEKKALHAETASLQAALAGLRAEAVNAQEDKIRTEGEITRVGGIIETLASEISSLAAEEKEGAGKIEEEEARRKEESLLAEGLSRKMEGLKSEAETLGGSRDSLTKRREEQTERLTSLRMSVMSAQKDIEAIRLGILNLEQALSGHGGKIAALEAQIRDYSLKNEQAGLGIEDRKAQAQSLREEAAAQRAGMEALAEGRREIERRTAELRAGEKESSAQKEQISREMARLEERKTAAQSEYDAVIARLWDEYGLTRSEAEKTAAQITDPQKSQRRLSDLKSQIKNLGDVNVGAIDEYKEVSERHRFLRSQTDDVEKSRGELNALIAELTSRMRSIFTRQFENINRNFGETFVDLFGGGSAKLTLTEPEDVLSSGIEINVQPPGKIIKNLSALSGGEQSFVAIALYFAILKVRPSPFCVLDEIEAALDDVNVSRFAAYLRRMCGNTQFIVITHRRGTMEEADVLYGVTMQEEGVSRLLTLNVAELVKKLGIG